MKRMLILVVITMLLAGPLFADEAVLIDFTLLAADIIPIENAPANRPQFAQNRQTLMDFSNVAGSSFTAQQRAVMKTSLAIENWEVTLASSSRTIANITQSYTREATSRGYWGEQMTVMGVRVHFPLEPFNSWATIRPPFEIPAFEPQADISDDGTIRPVAGNNGITGRSRFESQEDGQPAYGVVKNVGVIREVQVNVYGLNFPHRLFVLLIDSTGEERRIEMGPLNFEGWAPISWRNPAYVQEIRNRDLRLYPLYPTSTPFIKFGGFMIQRDASHAGGDFIGYFKDVSIIYDRAVLEPNRDIDDEALWNIISDRETARKIWEMERFGQNQVLRYLEQQRQATEPSFTDPSRNQDQQ